MDDYKLLFEKTLEELDELKRRREAEVKRYKEFVDGLSELQYMSKKDIILAIAMPLAMLIGAAIGTYYFFHYFFTP